MPEAAANLVNVVNDFICVLPSGRSGKFTAKGRALQTLHRFRVALKPSLLEND
jgi:hypothetical protein